ncbi:Rv3235 family protein [Streptomyces mirabilis]|nr:Rv3235 family protein [Streptomyces mirabilis]
MNKVMTRTKRRPGTRPPGRHDTRRPGTTPPRTPGAGAPPGPGRQPTADTRTAGAPEEAASAPSSFPAGRPPTAVAAVLVAVLTAAAAPPHRPLRRPPPRRAQRPTPRPLHAAPHRGPGLRRAGLARRTRPLRTRGARPVVRDIGYYVPRPGAIEAFARIGAGDRLRAMAFRLEQGPDLRWRCTAVELGGPRMPRADDD